MQDDQITRAHDLDQAVRAAIDQLDIDAKMHRLSDLRAASQQPDFWQDSAAAQATMKQIAELESQVQPWQQLATDVADILELTQLDDEEMAVELMNQLDTAELTFDQLKKDLRFAGPYDRRGAIVAIYAGAGGTDAQDWAAMLMRMYVRYADKQGWRVTTVDESPGETPNTIKSIVMEITGELAYGKLKGEHGVHRLVRLSPFNSAASRETSFAKVDVLPEIDAPDELQIDDKDLKIDVYRSGGHGGQSVNTTDSAVRITHQPTGIVVAIQNERSQLQNKETAMTILRSRLAQLQLEQHKDKVSELKGPSAANEFGSQIRNYVLHPYKQVKDLRSGYETSDPDSVLDGDLDPLIDAYLERSLGKE